MKNSTRFDTERYIYFCTSVNPGYEEGIVPDYPREVFDEHGPAIPLNRRGSDASSLHSENGIGVHRRSQWAKEEGPRDTAILLENLPSKQLGKCF